MRNKGRCKRGQRLIGVGVKRAAIRYYTYYPKDSRRIIRPNREIRGRQKSIQTTQFYVIENHNCKYYSRYTYTRKGNLNGKIPFEQNYVQAHCKKINIANSYDTEGKIFILLIMETFLFWNRFQQERDIPECQDAIATQ